MIIAIGHRKRTGKSQFATFLAEALRGTKVFQMNKKPVVILPLADPLKHLSTILYPTLIHPSEMYEDCHPNQIDKDAVVPELGMSTRQKWLDLGKLIYSYDPIAFPKAVCLMAPKDAKGKLLGDVIVPDLRRIDECQHFQRYGHVLFIRMDRAGCPSTDPGGHKLELELLGWDGWDVVIKNDGDLANLHNKAITLSGMIRGCDNDTWAQPSMITL